MCGQAAHTNSEQTLPMIAQESIANARIVSIAGQLNSGNAANVENEITGLIARGDHCFLLDFSHLDYISSAGLRVVLVVAKRLKAERGQLILFGMQPQVQEVFEISGFLSILEVAATREEAISRIR